MKHPSDFNILQQRSCGIYTTMRPLSLAGVPFGRRMIVIKNQDKVMLQSAFVADKGVQLEIDKLGKVTDIVVPTVFHDTFLDEVVKKYPHARYYCVPGAEKFLPGAIEYHPIENLLHSEWADVLTTIPLKGMPKVNESMFIHHPSKTLLVSDLFFNIQGLEGWWLTTFAKMLGFANSPSPSRLFKSMIKDKKSFSESLQEILEHDFEVILPSHFQVIEGGGKKVIQNISQGIS